MLLLLLVNGCYHPTSTQTFDSRCFEWQRDERRPLLMDGSLLLVGTIVDVFLFRLT